MQRLVLVDDHEMVRSAFSRLLNSQGDMTVVGETSTLEQAEVLIQELAPDVVSLDLELSGPSDTGVVLSLIRRIKGPAVVICSYRADPAEIRMLLEAGIAGYVTKSSPADELVKGIRAVREGRVHLCPLTRSVLAKARSGGADFALTPRQLEVLMLVGEGKNTREVAETLKLSPKTVENYRSAILDRLEANNFNHAISRARSLGILPQ